MVSLPLFKPPCLDARCRDSDVFALSSFVFSPHGSDLSCLAGSNLSLSLSRVLFARGSPRLTAFVSVPGAKTSMLQSHLCCRCVVATIVLSL